MTAARGKVVSAPQARARRSFTASKVEDEATERALAEVRQIVAPAVDCPLVSGVRVIGQKLFASLATTFAHKLGRVPVGYLVTKTMGNGSPPVYPPVFLAATDATITLSNYGTNAITVDLWVF